MFRSTDLEVRDLGRVLTRRRGIIAGFLLGFLALALVLNVVTPPVYRTAARLTILPMPSRSPLTNVIVETPTTASENLSLLTTAERIMSRDVLERVAREMRSRGVVLGRPVPIAVAAKAAANSLAATARAAAPSSGAETDAQLVVDLDWLAHNVSVRPLRDTRLVDVLAEHADPRAAAEIANSVAREFIRTQDESRRESDGERLQALRQQLAELRDVIQESERALYGSRTSTLAIAGERGRRLSDAGNELSSAAIRARADLSVIEAQLDRIRDFRQSADPDWSQPPVQTTAMDQLYRDWQKAQTQVLELRRQYRERSPEVTAAEAQADALRETMRRELQKTVSDLEGQAEVLRARVSGFESALSRNERSLKALNDSSYKYSTAESELKTKRELYGLLLQKVQELDVAQAVQPPNVEIVQDAAIPLHRVRPRKALNVALGLALGFVFGSGTAFALEVARRTIRTPQDVMHELRMPVLGMIPRRHS